MRVVSGRGLSVLVILGFVLPGLTACGDDDTTSPAQHYSRAEAVRFGVRSGTTINPGNLVGYFNSDTDEGFVEFPIDFPASSPVMIEFQIGDCCVGPSDPNSQFKVAFYPGDGVASTSKYGLGLQFASLTMPSGSHSHAFSLDVTASVDYLRSTGATHLGLRFYDSSFSQLAITSGGMLEAGP